MQFNISVIFVKRVVFFARWQLVPKFEMMTLCPWHLTFWNKINRLGYRFEDYCAKFQVTCDQGFFVLSCNTTHIPHTHTHIYTVTMWPQYRRCRTALSVLIKTAYFYHYRIWKKRRNQIIVGVEPVSLVDKKIGLGWFGHAECKMNVDGTKQWDCPRNIWRDCVKSIKWIVPVFCADFI